MEQHDNVMVVLKNKLTVDNAQKIYEELSAALFETKNIKVILKDIESIDISFVQLFCSFYKTAKEKGIQITVKKTFKEEHYDFFIKTGFCIENKDEIECFTDCVNLLIRGNG